MSVRIGKVIDATEDRLAVRRSRRYPDHTVVFYVSQDHTGVHAKEVSELVGPPPSQWLVDVFRLSEFAWRQARPSCILLANVRPEAFPVSITATMWVFKVLLVISIRTAGPRGILLETIDNCLRNGRLICRHLSGKVRIRHVKQ